MKNSISNNSIFFWNTARDFLYHQLPDIRKVSSHTIDAYRDSLNRYIDYLTEEKKIFAKDISFLMFSKSNLKDYLHWMLNIRKYAEKTCNLRLTAIHSLLEYAAVDNGAELMAIYLEAINVKGIRVSAKPIEYFEAAQMKALLAAPDIKHRIGRRNQMLLVLYYDTGARISELLEMKLSQLHLDAEIPYLTILGKGRKYRIIPLMDKTVRYLKGYLKEFHQAYNIESPIFYAVTHGQIHHLSSDTVEKMICRYSETCTANGIIMPTKPHCHMIRKTRAMDLYQNGVPLPHIQQLLGHEDMSTTSDFYAFATLDTLSKSMKASNQGKDTDTIKKWKDKNVLKAMYRL